MLAADSVGLRAALQDSQGARREAEGLVGELSEVVRQQKLRMRTLAQERAEAAARLQATQPQELERLRGELLSLRERAGELGAIRDQLAQERRLTESLQQRLAGAQQALLEARQEAAGRCGGWGWAELVRCAGPHHLSPVPHDLFRPRARRLADAEAALRAGREEATRRAAAAEAAAAEAQARLEQLAEEAANLRDAVKCAPSLPACACLAEACWRHFQQPSPACLPACLLTPAGSKRPWSTLPTNASPT